MKCEVWVLDLSIIQLVVRKSFADIFYDDYTWKTKGSSSSSSKVVIHTVDGRWGVRRGGGGAKKHHSLRRVTSSLRPRTGSWFSLCEEKKCNEIFIDSFTCEINSHVLRTGHHHLLQQTSYCRPEIYTGFLLCKIYFPCSFVYGTRRRIYIFIVRSINIHPQNILWYHNDEIKDWYNKVWAWR